MTENHLQRLLETDKAYWAARDAYYEASVQTPDGKRKLDELLKACNEAADLLHRERRRTAVGSERRGSFKALR